MLTGQALLEQYKLLMFFNTFIIVKLKRDFMFICGHIP